MTDPGRFERFVREYQDMVFGTAVRLLGRPADAEDVAQTVFLKAFEHFDHIATSPTVAGWLKTTARNLCLTHLARYRARWQFFSEIDGPPGESPAASRLDARIAVDATADRDLDTAGRHARLERALQALPDHQRVPLVLFHFEDLSYQDIAAELGVSLAKVKTDIHRGRATLKCALEETDGPR